MSNVIEIVNQLIEELHNRDIQLVTVDSYDAGADLVYVIRNGQPTPDAQGYPHYSSYSPAAADVAVLERIGSGWVATGKVGAPDGGGGVTDHGALTGLADDDHPQYAVDAHTHAHTDTTGKTANDHHNQIHNLVDTTNHPASGLTIDHVLKALSATTYGFGAQPSHAPAAHNLVDTTGHPVSGLTTGQVLRALSATTYGFAYLHELAAAAGDILGKLQAHASQTGDLLQFLDSAGVVLNNFDRHGRFPNPRTNAYVWDDFLNGSAVGQLNWNQTVVNSGAVSNSEASVASHPGMIRLSTGATGSSSAIIRGPATAGRLLPADNFDITYILRGNNSADVTMRVGLGNDSSAVQPAAGIYFEKLAAGTIWTGVCRSASTETLTASLATHGSGTWYRLRIRRIDASTIGFTLNDGTELTVATNVPTTTLSPFVVITNAVAADKTMDVDYFDLMVKGLSR